MTHPAVTVTPDVSVEDAARLMDERRIHRLVVTDADGKTPIGVLSVSDLVRAMGEWSQG
jgi:CBS domain-containing protein